MRENSIPDWLNVSRETLDRLSAFADLVRQWTQRINLVSQSSLADLWQRHVLDSAQLYMAAQTRGQHWVDIGSGGGFPGIVLAILAKELHPQQHFTLVEADQRKSVFLRKAAQELSLPVTTMAQRVELTEPLGGEIASARALAPLSALLPMIHRHLAPGGLAVLPKGAKAQEEIALAQQAWAFDLQVLPSRTDPQAQVLLIENLRHV